MNSKNHLNIIKTAVAFLFCVGALQPFNAAMAAGNCYSIIVPKQIAPRTSGGFDATGTLVSSNCTCANNDNITIDNTQVNDNVTNRYLALFIAAKANGTQIQVNSTGSCAASWFVPSAIVTYAVTAL